MARVLTLLYHRVIDLKYDKNLLAVALDNFHNQMSYLKNNYSIVRFEDDWRKLENDAVCITFDDGYADNFANALPILQELNIPATVFIATGTINTSEEFWWDELEKILLDRNKEYDSTFSLKDDFFSCRWPTDTFTERDELYNTLHWLMYNKITVAKRREWMEQLRKWSGIGKVEEKKNRVVQASIIRDIPSILTIGAHTVNHPSLRNLSGQDQQYEISRSITDLKNMCNRTIKVFSYPFGGHDDYDKTSIDICKKEGICKAASNFPGLWKPQCDDYQIPRNIVRNWNINEFVQKINEFWRLE